MRVCKGQIINEVDEGSIKMIIPDVGDQLEITVSGECIACYDVLVKPTKLTELKEAKSSFLSEGSSPEDDTMFVDKNDRLPAWKTNNGVVAFMDKHCEGQDRSAEAFASALIKVAESSGRSPTSVAENDLHENATTILAILLVLKLHKDLRPLVDKKVNDPDKITLTELKVLHRFPIEEQVLVWKQVCKEETITAKMLALYRLGDKYFKKRQRGRYKKTTEPII